MKESSSGKSAVLFPGEQTGENNYFLVGKDYALPTASWLKFDKHPGIERISLVFARERIDCAAAISGRYVTAYVSNDATSSKDLVPTRMQLSWGDPTPVIIPDDAQEPRSQKQAGLVKVTSSRPESVLSVDVALSHK